MATQYDEVASMLEELKALAAERTGLKEMVRLRCLQTTFRRMVQEENQKRMQDGKKELPCGSSPGYMRDWAKREGISLVTINSTEGKQYTPEDEEIKLYDAKHRTLIEEVRDWMIDYYEKHPEKYVVPPDMWAEPPAPFASREEAFTELLMQGMVKAPIKILASDLPKIYSMKLFKFNRMHSYC